MAADVIELRPQTKAERVYRHLRRQIRELTLPPGAALRKEEIAAELRVSRAPVSEAIARLAEEGLAEVYPQHGSFVAPIRAVDVRESLFIRTALECEAMRRLAGSVEEALIERLEANLASQEAALEGGDLPRFHDLDEALHEILFAGVETPRALRLLEAARAPLDRVRRLALPEPGRPAATLAEHRRIVEAVCSADPEYAAAAMRVHLSRVAGAIEVELAKIDPIDARRA
ncbi:MAG: GntR family transcriptional regulator [Caulobacteraceae bacterium]